MLREVINKPILKACKNGNSHISNTKAKLV